MTERINLKAALIAAVAAAAVFIILEMMLVMVVAGDSPWAPPRMIAAIVMGRNVLPPPATFDIGIMVAGMAVHFALAISYGVIFGFAAAALGLRPGSAAVGGLGFGVALYLVNFYLFTGLFPWFSMARNWMSLLAHAVFGIVLALVYVRAASPAPRGTTSPV